MKKFCKRAYLALILIFLYRPIVVLSVQSFNAGKSRARWEGLSLRWYAELFQDQAIMKALYITLTIAIIAANPGSIVTWGFGMALIIAHCLRLRATQREERETRAALARHEEL